jgi:hypothetical protein
VAIYGNRSGGGVQPNPTKLGQRQFTTPGVTTVQRVAVDRSVHPDLPMLTHTPSTPKGNRR